MWLIKNTRAHAHLPDRELATTAPLPPRPSRQEKNEVKRTSRDLKVTKKIVRVFALWRVGARLCVLACMWACSCAHTELLR